MFRNLVIYRLPAGWNVPAAELEDALSGRPLQPCGALDIESRGWVSPGPRPGFVHAIDGHVLIALGINRKILPGAVIKQEVQARAKRWAHSQGVPLGRKQLRQLKEEVTVELRAKALVCTRVIRAWIDRTQGCLIVEAASRARAEALVEALRDSLGTFAVSALELPRSPQERMAAWLHRGEAPGRLTLDTDLELQAADESKSAVRYVRHSLEGKDILTHLRDKTVRKLGFTWNDRVAFVLTHTLEVKRVKLFGVASDPPADAASESAEVQFDADFALMTGELAQVICELTAALSEVDPGLAAVA